MSEPQARIESRAAEPTPLETWTHTHAETVRDHWWRRPGWREDRTFYTWHVTFDGQSGLHRLVTAYQEALTPLAGLDLVPLGWLHLTMQGLGYSDEVEQVALEAVVKRVQERFRGIVAPVVTFQDAVIRPEAVALPVIPPAALATIRNAVRWAIADAWGGDHAVPEDAAHYQPHVSLAYVNTPGPSAQIRTALEQVEIKSVVLSVNAVQLIELRREGRTYQWDVIATAEISGNGVPRS